MNTGLTTIEVDPAAAAILQALQAKAEAKGVSLGTLLLPLTENDAAVATSLAPSLTPAERVKAWRDWVEHHSVSGTHFVDDSRESIYTREDEAL